MIAVQGSRSDQQRATHARASPRATTVAGAAAPAAPAARRGDDALGRRLAGVVHRRVAGPRALLQRANDKFVVQFDRDEVPEAIALLRRELAALYEDGRVAKTKARNALDVAQSSAVTRLADRQEALAILAHVLACKKLNEAHGLGLKPKAGAKVSDARDLLAPTDEEQVATAVAEGFRAQIEDG